MKIKFNINYKTEYGQVLKIVGNIPQLGNGDAKKAKPMFPVNGENGDWDAVLNISEKTPSVEYKYILHDTENNIFFEETNGFRNLQLDHKKYKNIKITDFWRSANDPKNVLFSSAFTKALFLPKSQNKATFRKLKTGEKKQIVKFNLRASRVSPEHKIGLFFVKDGKTEKTPKVNVLNNKDFPFWTKEISVEQKLPIQYKYCIYDPKQKKIVLEEYQLRTLSKPESKKSETLIIQNDEDFKYPRYPWKGAGVAIPVFSLRSKNGLGVGEFPDIKLLVDWAVKTGLKLVQILPINDTTATHRWTDSYPYAAISVFALHPIYLNLNKIAKIEKGIVSEIADEQKKAFNQKDFVDYENVMRTKRRILNKIFKSEKEKFLQNSEFIDFFEQNKKWLQPYAAFCFLRDFYGNPNFEKWGRFKEFSPEKLAELTNPEAEHYEDIAIHYFTQFHLHKQLLEATEYARKNGVVLKGDIPIGIYRKSVDAWVAPELYNMDSQAGAPPDDFAENGQNWKFPTYNWQAMAQQNYSWWKNRLKKMATYFDAYRIDHILGFFRIWEIPNSQTQGILGRFNPAIALSAQELAEKDFGFDLLRHARPYIRQHMLGALFGELTDFVKANYLVEYSMGQFYLKPDFDTQAKINKNLPTDLQVPPNIRKNNEKIKTGLSYLVSEVLFIEEEGSNATRFHPRHSFYKTWSFNDLDDNAKHKLMEVYNDYFYERNEDFWKEQAMQKLPELKAATEMLVCGEDLGMVPSCVPEVMSDLNMLSLEVQRMPKDPKVEFGHPVNYPYLSVATPSSHDTSTIREWWEEDTSQTQRFYTNILGKEGGSPFFCETWIVEAIINQHVYSPSIWAIFPIQDLLGMNEKLRRLVPQDERINVPANPQHFWKYRLHLNIENLLQEDDFNNHIKEMMKNSGRLYPY